MCRIRSFVARLVPVLFLTMYRLHPQTQNSSLCLCLSLSIFYCLFLCPRLWLACSLSLFVLRNALATGIQWIGSGHQTSDFSSEARDVLCVSFSPVMSLFGV